MTCWTKTTTHWSYPLAHLKSPLLLSLEKCISNCKLCHSHLEGFENSDGWTSTQVIWDGDGEFSFLKGPQVMLMALAQASWEQDSGTSPSWWDRTESRRSLTSVKSTPFHITNYSNTKTLLSETFETDPLNYTYANISLFKWQTAIKEQFGGIPNFLSITQSQDASYYHWFKIQTWSVTLHLFIKIFLCGPLFKVFIGFVTMLLLNCGIGEESWESLGLQGEPTSQS